LTAGTILAVLVPVVVFALVAGKPKVEPGRYDALAQCLSDKGVKMYGAYWCSHCQNQKEMFGESFSKVDYVECSLPGGQGQTDECAAAGISGYPTWEFGDGSRVEGELQLSVLAQKSGCE